MNNVTVSIRFESFRFKYEALMLVCLILIESRKLKSLVPKQNQISRQMTNDFVFLGMQSSYLSKCANCILSCCALYLLLNKVIPIFASTEPSQLVRAPIDADALWYVWSRKYANKGSHSLKRNLNNNLEQDRFQFWWTILTTLPSKSWLTVSSTSCITSNIYDLKGRTSFLPW